MKSGLKVKTREQLVSENKRLRAVNNKLKQELALAHAKLLDVSAGSLGHLLASHKLYTAKIWSEKSGVHRVTIANLMAGKKHRPNFETLRKLAKPLKIDELELYKVLTTRGNFKAF